MKYRVSSFGDMETGTHMFVVQKKKWLVFWKDVYYSDSERDAYKHRRILIGKEK